MAWVSTHTDDNDALMLKPSYNMQARGPFTSKTCQRLGVSYQDKMHILSKAYEKTWSTK